jgi:thiol-disulfide isomerase/thioredoxin
MPLHRFAAILLGLPLALAACEKKEERQPAANVAAQTESIKGVHRDKAGQPLPDAELRNAEDEAASLADEKGEPLLVNIWATWCAPCVKELPTLQELDTQPGAPRVIAISQDMAPRGSVDAFIEKNKLGRLEVWHDPKMAVSDETGAEVLPTTILYDANGRELWRYVGDLDWTSAEAAKLLSEAGGKRSR